jgi:nitroreductase
MPDQKQLFYDIIESRRSIRKFKTDPVAKELIAKVVNAGLHAPSGKNRQNWKFFVATGSKRDEYLKYSQKSWLNIKDILQTRLKPSLYEFTERFFFTLGEAPVLVFCYSYNDSDEKYLTSIGSVYMAVENINLACVAEGLGCCTMGAPLEIKDDVNIFLNLQNDPDIQSGKLELLCGLVIGWPDHNPPKAPRQTDGKIIWL